MYPRTRRKKRTESMEATTGERDGDEEDEDNDNQQRDRSKIRHQRQHDVSTANAGVTPVSVVGDNNQRRSPTTHIAHLLHEANLNNLVQLDWVDQIKYFLNERSHLINQIEFVRTQFEKQYSSVKRRLDETESENERLTTQNRSTSKELLLYKSLVEAPDYPDSPTKSKDYQQLKLHIDAVLKENERLYSEIHDFKTSDPVYEQVQLLESANRHLKQELIQATNMNHRMKKMANVDEMRQLTGRLNKTMDECEQLRLLNKKLLSELEIRDRHPSTSPIQLRAHPAITHHQQLSPASHRSILTLSSTSTAPVLVDESIRPLTTQNLRRLDAGSRHTVVGTPLTSDIVDIHDHVRRLEQTLHQRDYELQRLQIEIEKGTSSIMSSIEDLFLASSNSQQQQQPNHLAITSTQHHPNIEDLQNEIDQLHDKLDELSRENQTLKNRTQEFDTIYEENEYLYAEKTHWNEEMERARVRELVLEQELRTLKERDAEKLANNDVTTPINASPTQLKLKIDWLHRANNQLELEVVRLREQLELMTQKCEQTKRDLHNKDEHYKRLLAAAEDAQRLPQELARLEKLNADMEAQFERERQDYEKSVIELEEQRDKREQKYSSLYETILQLQSDSRQKEYDYAHQFDEFLKQRDEFNAQLTSIHTEYEQIQLENKALKEEIKSKDEINRDLKLALTSSNNDTQTVYNQLRQLNTSLTELQQKYDRDLAERDIQMENYRMESKKLITNYDSDLHKTHQTIIQLQHENSKYASELERYRTNVDKLHVEIDEKQHFIEQVQHDLTERSALHVNINTQLAQENKARATRITELEQALAHEHQRKTELQRTVQELQSELLKTRATAKESLEKSHELERRFHETDKRFEESLRIQLNENTEPTRRELSAIRSELMTKADQLTVAQHALDEEKLKRQRLEMKLKRLKEEYVAVRKELYHRVEETNNLQHELVECRFKNDYNLHITNQTINSLRSVGDNDQQGPPTTAVQLYLKEKADNQHWQLKCRTYQQKIEQLQKNYELAKEKYKQRVQEDRDAFERAKMKYLEHIRNVQRDLHDTRQLLEKDAEFKSNQESAYQQLIDERRQLLTSMVDKDAKVREMRRENLLLTSKIQLLEDQMENLNDRVDRTLRERNQLRREINSVRFDSNVSIETSARSSPVQPARTMTLVDAASWSQPVHYTESFGFNNGHSHEVTTTIS